MAEQDTSFKQFEGPLDFLFRSNSAIMGGLSFAARGKDPVEGAVLGLKRGELSGQDVVSAVTGRNRDDPISRRVGLGLDIANIADPINFLGFGALTKGGKALRAVKGVKGLPQLAEGIGAQTRAGQRGLVTFGGNRIPLPGDAFAMEQLGKAGTRLAESGAGQTIKKAFGGARGAFGVETRLAGVSEEHANILLKAEEQAKFAAQRAHTAMNPFSEAFQVNLRGDKEFDAALDILDRATLDPATLPDDIRKFVGSGKGSERRQKAMDALNKFMVTRDEVAKAHGTASSLFTDPKIGFASRIRKDFDVANTRRFGENAPIRPQYTTGTEVGTLTGPDANIINRGQAADATLDISIDSLTPEGLTAYFKMDPEKALIPSGDKAAFDAKWKRVQKEFDKLTPEQKVAFNHNYRMRIKDQHDKLASAGAVGLVKDPVKLTRDLQNSLVNEIRYDELVNSLRTAGHAKTHDELIEALVKENGGAALTDETLEALEKSGLQGRFVRVNQGKFAKEPLWIEKSFETAVQKYNETFLPSADKPMFAQFLNDLLPKHLQDLGVLSWWKGFALFGVNPSGFWIRNFATGVHKNMMEGLSPLSAPEMQRTGELYKEAFTTVWRSLGGKLDSEALDIGKAGGKFGGPGDEWVTKQGVKVSRLRLIEEYMGRAFHGGGNPNQEIIRGIENMSTKGREAAFGHFHRGTFRVEMAIRMPLMMKYIEDTIDAAMKNGMKVGRDIPDYVGPLSKSDDFTLAPGSLWDQAMVNAREAVIRAHFDYNDLSPLEKKIRNSVIPFYTWMRKNIPNETVNMIQNSGRYMPYARAYYSSFQQQGIKPEDLPEWAQHQFAVALSKDPEGDKVRWMDFTGFLPFSDVRELAQAAHVGVGAIGIPFVETGVSVAAEPQTGRTPTSEMIRYLAIRSNPFIVQLAEQGLQRNFFTGRAFNADTPQDIFGISADPQHVNAANLIRGLKDIDRLNIGQLFGGPGKRPHRNEPSGFGEKVLRNVSGVKVRSADPDLASLSRKARMKRIRTQKRRAREALRDGDESRQRFHMERVRLLERGL